MSVNYDIRHLYNDAYFSSAGFVLDAKDRLKTRKLNAREKRYLDHQIDVLEKAKDICCRSRNWDRHYLHGQLGQICLKTPSFNQHLIDKVRKQVNIVNFQNELPAISTQMENLSMCFNLQESGLSERIEPKISKLTLPSIPGTRYDNKRHIKPAAGSNILQAQQGNNRVVCYSYRRRSDHVVKSLVRHYIRVEQRNQITANKQRASRAAKPGSFNYRSYMAIKSTEDAKLTEENLQIFLNDNSYDHDYYYNGSFDEQPVDDLTV